MVVFELMSKDEYKIVYKYYPENHTDKKPSLITIRPSASGYELEPAEEDFLCFISVEELDEMYNVMNQMCVGRVEPELTEKEILSETEDEEWYQYSDHAIHRIFEEYDKSNIPEKEMVSWYGRYRWAQDMD